MKKYKSIFKEADYLKLGGKSVVTLDAEDAVIFRDTNNVYWNVYLRKGKIYAMSDRTDKTFNSMLDIQKLIDSKKWEYVGVE